MYEFLTNPYLFYGSAFLVAGAIAYCLHRWHVPIEKWRHKHFGTNEHWRI